MKKILVIAPHPDDETLGCGGTILKHKFLGDKVYWLIVTNISKLGGWTEEQVNTRNLEIESISKLYDFDSVYNLGYLAATLDSVNFSDVVKSMGNIMMEVKPDTIYVNNRSDIHTDHQVVFKAAMSCTKSFRYNFISKILMYETMSETDYSAPFPDSYFIPNVYIDISDYFKKKCLIMKKYKSEVMQKPLPRSISTIEALAKLRGSRAGVEFAEAFSLVYEKL
jgi:N-acetylglucosamine malate deacetylase 1